MTDERLGDSHAEHAQSQNPDVEPSLVHARDGFPSRFSLRLFVALEFAIAAKHGVADVLDHLFGHAGVDQAHHGHGSGPGQIDQRVNPGAEVEDRARSVETSHQFRGRLPHNRVIDDRRNVGPEADVGFR